MKRIIKKAVFALCFILLFSTHGEAELNLTKIDTARLYFPVKEQLTEFYAQALTGPVLSLYMVHAAQKYPQLFNDTTISKLPLKDRSARIFVVHPADESDTLYQIDVRIYSPSYVGRRYNRMIIIRPYDAVKRPCVLYTHGNSGNLNTWYNYYLTGVTSLLERGYAIAFYENYNNSNFTADKNTDIVYKDWIHHNLADSTENLPDDHALQRGHYLLYQYAYAAHTYLTYIADEYNLDKEMLFTAGHSAGGLSSMQLTFARPERNFQHPVFNFCGTYNSRTYPEISEDRIPIKGVFCSAAGLQDDTVEGSYFGTYFDENHQDKVVVFAHGALDPLAPVNYGPALWNRFTDTVKIMGPLSLKKRMDQYDIKSYSFINCIGQHGVYSYPKTTTDKTGIFRDLSPFSYDHVTLSDEDFYEDQSLYQVLLYHQQMDSIMKNVAMVFSGTYHKKTFGLPSSLYTWEPEEFTALIDSTRLNWSPETSDCGLEDANNNEFIVKEPLPVKSKEHQKKSWLIYPNPAQDNLYIGGLNGNPKISIFDLMGKRKQEVIHTGEKKMIDTSQLENGIYFLSFQDTETREMMRGKFIIQR